MYPGTTVCWYDNGTLTITGKVRSNDTNDHWRFYLSFLDGGGAVLFNNPDQGNATVEWDISISDSNTDYPFTLNPTYDAGLYGRISTVLMTYRC